MSTDKVIITGGLGYIGSKIVQLYKEDDCEIIVVDNSFKPHQIASLPDHVKFIEGDVKDIDLMERVLDGADLLYYMAAEVEAENSLSKENIVWENNYEAPKALFDICDDDLRVMFPSTGNVFGGVDEDGKNMNIVETDPPKPRYPYAQTKAAIEKYLRQSDQNYTIVRFGTNRGFSPGVRFNLVTNIFILNAIQERPITVHGEGLNYRPTVSVNDAARGIKFLSDQKQAERDIYHVVQKSYQIKELAEEVVRYSGKDIPINHLAKDVPFNSYHLKGDKITELGFEYEWPLERDVQTMLDIFNNVSPSQEFFESDSE